MSNATRLETPFRNTSVMHGEGTGWMANLKRVLWHLLGGTRGGPLRIRLLALLRQRPFNTNQLATKLGVDYKTVQHHIRVLKQNRILEEQGSGQYGSVFFFSKDMQESLDEFDAIAAKVAPEAAASRGTGDPQ